MARDTESPGEEGGGGLLSLGLRTPAGVTAQESPGAGAVARTAPLGLGAVGAGPAAPESQALVKPCALRTCAPEHLCPEHLALLPWNPGSCQGGPDLHPGAPL